MCGRCVIFTYDEVLDIIKEIEVGAFLNIESDLPARRIETYPKSAAPLIVPAFDTAVGVSGLAEGGLSARELSWGFQES